MNAGSIALDDITRDQPIEPPRALAHQPLPLGGAAALADDRILLLDDHSDVRRVFGAVLKRAGYECATAATVPSAHALLAEGAFELALCDLRLPGESGVGFVRSLRHMHPDVAAIVITGYSGTELAETLFGLGVDSYLVKPFTPNELLITISGALARRKNLLQERTERERRGQADGDPVTGGGDPGFLPAEEAIGFMARSVELHSAETAAHSERVAAFSGLLARKLGLEESRAQTIALASQLHDIGMLGISDGILLKNGVLTPGQRAEMERHPELGYAMLAPSASSSDLVRTAATIALTHHERFDGFGYPGQLAGAAIPLAARIVAVADVFDALTNDRPYRPALPVPAAVAKLTSESGRAFDPLVANMFLTSLDEVLALAGIPA